MAPCGQWMGTLQSLSGWQLCFITGKITLTNSVSIYCDSSLYRTSGPKVGCNTSPLRTYKIPSFYFAFFSWTENTRWLIFRAEMNVVGDKRWLPMTCNVLLKLCMKQQMVISTEYHETQENALKLWLCKCLTVQQMISCLTLMQQNQFHNVMTPCTHCLSLAHTQQFFNFSDKFPSLLFHSLIPRCFLVSLLSIPPMERVAVYL